MTPERAASAEEDGDGDDGGVSFAQDRSDD